MPSSTLRVVRIRSRGRRASQTAFPRRAWERGGWSPGTGPQHSREDLPDHMSMNVRQPALCSVVIKDQLLVVQPEQMQHSGVKVVHIDHVFNRLVTKLVGRAEAEALLD